MDSLSSDELGTSPSFARIFNYGASGTPSLQLILEETLLSRQTPTVVTSVRFDNSLTVEKTSMSKVTKDATEGATGGTSTPGKGQDKAASKGGARPNEDVGQGAKSPDPRQEDFLLTETSPCRSPSTQHNRECYTLLFGIENVMMHQDAPGTHQIPSYAWTEPIITDILQPTVEEMTQAIVVNDRECLIFCGPRSRGEGLPYDWVTCYAAMLHGETTTWVGRRVWMHCIPRTLKDAKNDLRHSRDFI